jgi:repressor LexA
MASLGSKSSTSTFLDRTIWSRMPKSLWEPCVSGNVRVSCIRFFFGFLGGKRTMPLTKRQKEILDFIHAFIDQHGYAPSFEEIADSFGYSSLATVHEHLSNLERKGYIRKSYNESRSIEMVPEDGTISAMELPLLGTVAAGLPIEAVEDQESLAVPLDMIRPGKDNFVLRVEGDSMIEEQIRDGDYIVVSSQPTASDGEVVVALVGGDSVTVKRLYRESKDRIRLQPANSAMDPILVDASEVAVQGVVVGLIRRF